jgi:hypothetical protein
VVACYFNVNFRVPPNLFSILEPTALQILARSQKQTFSTVSTLSGRRGMLSGSRGAAIGTQA